MRFMKLCRGCYFFSEFRRSSDAGKTDCVMKALLQMKKIDESELKKAFEA
mgnify:CR=1 FL=1